LVALACLVLAFGLVAVMPLSKKAEAANPLYFTILHTNDEHSELIPYGPASDYPTYPTTGGFSRLATAIGTIKAQKAAASEPVLTLGAGDFTQGTLYSAMETTPQAGLPPELFLLKQLGYDALALGNHEFDLGTTFLAGELNIAKNVSGVVGLPLLSANINVPGADPLNAWLSPLDASLMFHGDTASPDLKIQNYTVKTLPNGLKVGIFGLLGVAAEAVSNASPVTFGNIYTPTGAIDESGSFFNRLVKAQQMINYLKLPVAQGGQGCNVVIALSHSGVSEETGLQSLGAMLSGLDVLIGGHSHDLVYPPMLIDNTGGGKTIYAQAGRYTDHLGELELQYENGKVTLRNGTAIKIDQNIPTNPAIDAIIGQYTAGLSAEFHMNILSPVAETDLAGNGGFNLNNYPSSSETNMGDLVTDAYRTVGSAYVAPTPDPTPIQIAFEANGVIRAGIPKGGLGHFSFYDVDHVVPLGGSATDLSKPGYSLISYYLAGAEILGVLNATLDLNAEGENDFFVQVSGAKYKFNPVGPTMGKLLGLKVQGAGGTWQDINPAALYRVTSNYYVASVLQKAFNVKPRDKTGVPQTVDYAAFKLLDAGAKELRCWEALFGYIMAMPDLDADGLKNVVPTYAANQGRIQSTTWYMAEGSTLGGMQTYVLVQNPSASDVHVNIKFHTDGGLNEPAALQGVTIPAKSRRTFLVNDYASTFDVSTVVEALDGEVACERAVYGDGMSWGTDCIGTTSPSAAWYLAEGSTDGGMETWVLIQNPSDNPINVNVKFQTDAGENAPAALQDMVIPKQSRKSIKVNDYVTNYNVSTYVEALNGGVVCERAMYGPGKYWAHDSIGATAPTTDWYMAEGSTDGGMETYVLVQNPYSSDVHVNVKFQTGAGEVAPADLQGVTIPAKSRRTFKANDYVTSYDVSTYVKAIDGNVVCERATYGNSRIWATESIAVNAASSSWYLPEGATEGSMEDFILVQNPGTADVLVNIKFQTDSGEVDPAALQGVTIPAKSRRTFKVNDYVTTYNVSTKVEGTNGSVVCERAMYGNGRVWATGSIGYAPPVW
jgi:5'-nucleotidase / UDP-sugar diphosphatase